MLCRPRPPAHEDPAVAAVEQILTTAASARVGADLLSESRVVAANALWICACITSDYAPTWLIYDTPDGGLAWQRVPDGVEPLDLIDTRLSAGGHADPAEVLRWLQGAASDPWSGVGDGNGNATVLDELREKIRSSD